MVTPYGTADLHGQRNRRERARALLGKGVWNNMDLLYFCSLILSCTEEKGKPGRYYRRMLTERRTRRFGVVILDIGLASVQRFCAAIELAHVHY